MQTNEFKKSMFGLDKKAVFSYLDTLSRDLENKLRIKDDEIRKLKKDISDTKLLLDASEAEFNDFKEHSKNEAEAFMKSSQEELRLEKESARKTYDELWDKYNSLLAEYTNETGKISGAILRAENAANEIIGNATYKANEIIEAANLESARIIDDANKKADVEEKKYKRTKADVSDFTYDIKRLLDKLSTDIKDKID